MNPLQMIDVNDVIPVTGGGGEIKVFASPRTIGTTQLIMGCALLKPGEKIHQHCHDYGEEVILVANGQGTIVIDGHHFNVQKGMACLAKQGQSHEVINQGHEILELIFASAPLAPTPSQGHRDLKKI